MSIKFHGNRISLTANTKLNFYGADSKDKFLINKETLGKEWKYYDSGDRLSYEFDEFGFRNQQSLHKLQYNRYIVTVGCSHTMGTGLFHEETYSFQLEQQTGIPVYNMGLGGSSNEVSMFNLMWLLSNFKPPRMIVFQKTGINRFPLIDSRSSSVSFNGPWVSSPWMSSSAEKIKEFIVISDEIDYNNTKQLMLESMLQQITSHYGIELLILPEVFINNLPSHTSKARELLHGGSEFNREISDYISEYVR